MYIPNTLDGKGYWLTDPTGAPVDLLSTYDPSCSVQPPQIQTGPVQDQAWTECYRNLQPDTEYTAHVVVTCYDPSGPHELATSTFRTAAN